MEGAMCRLSLVFVKDPPMQLSLILRRCQLHIY